MAYAICKDCGVQSDQNGLINHKNDCPIRQKILEAYGEPMPLITPLQYLEEVSRLKADLRVLHARVAELEEEIEFVWELVEQQTIEGLGIFHGSLVATNPDVDAVKSILADLNQTAISHRQALGGKS